MRKAQPGGWAFAFAEFIVSRVSRGFATLLHMVDREYHFYVYILSSLSRNLYTGMTNNLRRRVEEHRSIVPGTHTAQYNIWRLVYFERYQYVKHAIAREKEIKGWTREKKVELIEKVNPTWEDLAEGW